MKTKTLTSAMLFSTVLISGCRQQMADQPAYRPFQPASFFEDKRSARPLVPGTIARGHLRKDEPFYTGLKSQKQFLPYTIATLGNAGMSPFNGLVLAKTAEPFVDDFPLTAVAEKLRLEGPEFQLLKSVLNRGQQRYNIFCAVCHGRTGTGRGMIVERGYAKPPSYHTERLRAAPLGRLYQVITNGYGAMPAHAVQIPRADRWVIVAYVRALQFSQNASLSDVHRILKQSRNGGERSRIPASVRKALAKEDPS